LNCLLLLLDGLDLGGLKLVNRLAGLAPLHNKCLADQEQHDADLSDREEAPDAGLLKKVGGDHRGGEWAGRVEEEALEGHALLLIQSKEGGEHQERVEANALNVVGAVREGDRPAEVDHGLGLEGAQLLSSDPLGALSGIGSVPSGDVAHREAHEDQKPTDNAETLDDSVLIAVLHQLGVVFSGVRAVGLTRETFVKQVAEVGLGADVHEAKDGQDLVDEGVADGGLEVRSEVEVLNRLKGLHGEEEKDTSGQLGVVGLVVNPGRHKQAKEGEASGHVTVKAHLLFELSYDCLRSSE
jgi:hypothetical protein